MIDRIALSVKEIVVEVALGDFGLILGNDRIQVTRADVFPFDSDIGRRIVKATLRLATLEEPLGKYPSSLWQHIKSVCFPKWLKRRFPVQYEELIAIHKFPELNPPEWALGREFVHIEERKVE